MPIRTYLGDISFLIRLSYGFKPGTEPLNWLILYPEGIAENKQYTIETEISAEIDFIETCKLNKTQAVPGKEQAT